MIPFSVLISTYINDDVFQFDQCLESIRSQTSKPNEVVIINDGHLLPEQEEIISKYKMKLNIKSYLYEGEGQLGGALRFDELMLPRVSGYKKHSLLFEKSKKK